MDTRERVALEVQRAMLIEGDAYTIAKEATDAIMRVVDEERADLVKALEPFATWRCEDPIRKEVVPTNYASHTLLHDCGKCDTCKARAAIAKATGK